MPQFVIRLAHSSDQCPASNSRIRERAVAGGAQIPELAKKHGVSFLAGPLVLDAEHEGIAIVEADSVEAVHRFVFASGLMQWNAVRVSFAQTLQESIRELENAPPAIY